MNEWKNFSLGDVCIINAESYSNNDNWTFVNYLDTGNITANKIENIQRINIGQDKLPSRARRKVKYNSIIYSTVRPNQRHYGIVKSQPKNFLVSTGFAVIDVNSELVDADFLYYQLSRDDIVEKLHTLAEQSTSTYPSIRPVDIENLRFNFPPLETQKKIAAVLSALDDKIELNNAINKNLEEQAQTIYKKMFVEDFNPAWRKGTLSDIAEITMGQSPNGKSYNDAGQGMIFFQGRTDFGFRFPTTRMFTTEPKRIASKNDILFSVRAPVGDYNIALENCCIGRGLAALSAKNNYHSFLFYTMFYLKQQLEIYNGQGTVFGAINQQELKRIEVVIPEQSLINEFEKIVNPMDEIILNNHLENKKLGEIRDALLPRLMSGEIDVSKVKI